MVCGLDTSSGAREAVCLPESTPDDGRQKAIVVVDPLSSGAVLAQVRCPPVAGAGVLVGR
jgi:hypothetical protein